MIKMEGGWSEGQHITAYFGSTSAALPSDLLLVSVMCSSGRLVCLHTLPGPMLNAKAARCAYLLCSRTSEQQGLTYGARCFSQQGPVRPVEQPMALSEDGTKMQRERKHGDKSLPLPPLMDPIVIKARNRYTQPKPREAGTSKTHFQKQLERNPYGKHSWHDDGRVHRFTYCPAQALATPIRQCRVTHARLPSHFLIPFVSTIAPSEGESNERIKARIQLDIASADPHHLRSPSRIYVLAQRRIFDFLVMRKHWARLISERMKLWLALKATRQPGQLKESSDWIWDEKTAEKVLEMLRKDAAEALGAACREGRAMMLKEKSDWETVPVEDLSCVLFNRRAREQESPSESGMMAFTNDVGFSLDGGVAMYDFTWLFGNSSLQEICNGDDFVSEVRWVVLLKDSKAVQLQTRLLKLGSYLRSNNLP